MKTILSIFLILILFACSEKRGKEFEYQGGTIRMCIENAPFTKTSYEMEDYYSFMVYRQVMEGLVSINPKTTKLEPQLATNWKISDDHLTYTFTLRKNVYFHPNEAFDSDSDREFCAEDVIATFTKICQKNENGQPTIGYNYVFKDLLEGAEDCLNGNSKTVKGLSIKNDKVVIKLTHRDDNFLYKLSTIQASILAKEIIDAKKMNEANGTGPFMFDQITDEEMPRILLKKNPEYYGVDEDGYQLPFLDAVEFLIQNRKLEQLDLFENKDIDLILGLPTSSITNMLDGRLNDFNSVPPKLMMYKNPVLTTNYYFFNMEDERFKDPRVRMAFNYAIDKSSMGREILRNQYDELGIYGIVPPVHKTFRGYDFELVKANSYEYNVEKARKLLAEAGYPNGEGFGSVDLRFNIGDINSAIADDFSRQIYQVLGINVNIDGSTFEQLNADATNGHGDIFRSAWTADYPNPETFLNNFYGKYIPNANGNMSGINQAKYYNQNFDKYLDEAKSVDNLGQKMKLYAKAEAELMKDPPIIPLWYSGDIQIIHSYVRNLHFNSLSIFDFKTVYIKQWTAEEYQEKLSKEKR